VAATRSYNRPENLKVPRGPQRREAPTAI